MSGGAGGVGPRGTRIIPESQEVSTAAPALHLVDDGRRTIRNGEPEPSEAAAASPADNRKTIQDAVSGEQAQAPKASDAEVHDTLDLAPARASSAPVSPREAVTTSHLPENVNRLGRTFADGQQLRARGYRIASRVGKGGFSEVYSAVDERTGNACAIKVLNVLQASEPTSVERFKLEGALLNDFRGETGIVEYREMFDEPGVGGVLVMELLKGSTLRDHMMSGPVGMLEALCIIKKAARPVALLHHRKIVHRDLKPENIMLEPVPGTPPALVGEISAMRVVILDFGIAKTKDGPVTSSSSILGTWQYVCPEQLARGEICPGSDVYALGCILYEVMEREGGYDYLVREKNGGVNAACHVVESVKMPQRIPVSIWNRIVRPALEKDPAARFGSALDFIAAIDAWEADHHAGRLKRDDYEAACDAGPAALPPPAPLRREGKRVADQKPAQIDLMYEAKEPSLVIVAPVELAGARYAIGRTLTIGRFMPGEDPAFIDADLTLPEETVSGTHCRLDIGAEEAARFVYIVEDLKSRNGTSIDRIPIKDGFLRPGQVLRIGAAELLLLGPGKPDPAAHPIFCRREEDLPLGGSSRGPYRTRPDDVSRATPTPAPLPGQRAATIGVAPERRKTHWSDIAFLAAVLAMSSVVVLAVIWVARGWSGKTVGPEPPSGSAAVSVVTSPPATEAPSAPPAVNTSPPTPTSAPAASVAQTHETPEPRPTAQPAITTPARAAASVPGPPIPKLAPPPPPTPTSAPSTENKFHAFD